MKKEYKVEIERIHHSECFINYQDSIGKLKIWADQSPSPEYDFVTSEPNFEVTGERLLHVIENIQEWAKNNNFKIKIWKEDELGV